MKEWNTIPDDQVRHIWCDPSGNDEIEIDPSWYADNGTPICGCDSDYDGEDMQYVRTEISQPDTFDALLRALLSLCPGGQMGVDNDGQLVFYTGTRELEGGTVEPFEDGAGT